MSNQVTLPAPQYARKILIALVSGDEFQAAIGHKLDKVREKHGKDVEQAVDTEIEKALLKFI